MVVKNGKHRLVGFVELGPLHNDMLTLEGNLWTKLPLECFCFSVWGCTIGTTAFSWKATFLQPHLKKRRIINFIYSTITD